MEKAIVLVAVVSELIIAFRLITYHRDSDSRYRPSVSVFAYLLIVCAGGAAIDTAVNGAPVSIWEAGMTVVVAALVCRAKGNLGDLMRCNHV